MPSRPPRPACDLCYSRKVRCDREELCGNCQVAGVACLRTRPTPSVRSRQSKISKLASRVAQLESSAHSPSTASPAETRPTTSGRIFPALSPSSSPSTNCARRTALNQQGMPHQYGEERESILSQLNHGSDMDQTRRRVLEGALHVVNRLSKMPSSFAADCPLTGGDDSLDDSSGNELLYMISSEYNAQWPDHIPKRSLARMVSGLIERTQPAQTLFQYELCVYAKELFRISRWDIGNQSEPLAKQLRRNMDRYKTKASRALQQLNMLCPPSLTLVQALVSGAMLMQFLGNMTQSWILTSSACRTATFLNYHSLDINLEDEDSLEIASSVIWCYYLDKVLSGLFLLPSTLPTLTIDPIAIIDSDTSIPLPEVARFMLKMASIMERAGSVQPKSPETADVAQLNALIQETHLLHDEFIPDPLPATESTRYDWIAGTFCYHAMLNSLLHIRFSLLKQKKDHEFCLGHSRAALSKLSYLEYTTASANPSPHDASFLTWTILLFPLRPFFSLFCNAVSAANFHDFQLLQTATHGLGPFIATSPYASKLHQLFTTLLDLCAPVFPPTDRSNPPAPTGEDGATNPPTVDACPSSETPTPVRDSSTRTAHIGCLGSPEISEDQPSSVLQWDESQMLLFNSVPSLGWLETVSSVEL